MKSKIIFSLVVSIISINKAYSMKYLREASLQEHEVQQKHSTCKRHKRQHSQTEALRCKIFSLPIELRALTLEQLLRDYLKLRDFNTLKHVVQAFHADEASKRSYYYLLKNKDILVHILQDINAINSRTENPISKFAFLNILMNNNLDQLQDWKIDYLGTNVFPELQRWYEAKQITENQKPPFNIVLETYKNGAIRACKKFLLRIMHEGIRRGYSNEDTVNRIKNGIRAGSAVNCVSDDGRFTPLIAASHKNDKLFVDILIAAGADVNAQDANGVTALILASDRGYMEIVDRLIEAGADVNVQDANGVTALMLASQHGYIKIVDSLIKAVADVNVQDANGVTTLMAASHRGDMEIVDRLIEAGADVNVQNSYGVTALMAASNRGHMEIVDRLIEAGADVNVQSSYGVTALMAASNRGYMEIVDRLIEAGC